MQQQYYLGYEIKAVSNLMRRKIWSLGEGHQEMLPEIEGVVLGFLCHNQEQNIYQKDLEKTGHPLPPACSGIWRTEAL